MARMELEPAILAQQSVVITNIKSSAFQNIRCGCVFCKTPVVLVSSDLKN
jgi:hypothetical protein